MPLDTLKSVLKARAKNFSFKVRKNSNFLTFFQKNHPKLQICSFRHVEINFEKTSLKFLLEVRKNPIYIFFKKTFLAQNDPLDM